MAKSPSTLYHYCPSESFMAILASGNLRLSHASGMNDSLELKHLNRIIDKLETDIPEGIDKTRFLEILKYYSVETHLLLTCFSEDSDSLSQWRGYADDACGFAIGFNSDALPPALNPIRHSKFCIGLVKVNYDAESAETKIIKTLKYDYKVAWKDIPIPYDREAMLKGHAIKQLAHQYKANAFHEEKEWRILYWPERIVQANLADPPLPGFGFRNSKYGLIPFFDYNFKGKCASPISEVILGPKNPTSAKMLEGFLRFHGYENVTIKTSAASYR